MGVLPARGRWGTTSPGRPHADAPADHPPRRGTRLGGSPGAHQPRLRPRDRRADRRARPRLRRAGRRGRPIGPPGLAGLLAPRVAGAAHPRAVPLPRAAPRPPRGGRRARHRASTARRSRTRSARSPAASRWWSSPAASRTLLKGGHSEDVATGVDAFSLRQPLGVCAGVTPFNFPAMVPLWICRSRSPAATPFVLKPSEKVPLAAIRHGPSCGPRPGCPTGCSASCTATARPVDALLEHPRGRRRVLRRLDAASARTSTRRPPPRTASGCRRSAAPRTTWWSCPTPTSTAPPTPLVGAGVRLRGRALHGGLSARSSSSP